MELLAFILLHLEKFLVILKMSSLLERWFENISVQSVACFFLSLIGSGLHRTKFFNFEEIQLSTFSLMEHVFDVMSKN